MNGCACGSPHLEPAEPDCSLRGGASHSGHALQQLFNVSRLPVVGPHVAVMPDVHWGIGAPVGSVIPTTKAIIPAAVGVTSWLPSAGP